MNELAAKLYDSELEVLQTLWDGGGTLPLSELRIALADKCGWEYSTVKTVLRRLQAKQVVTLEQRGVYRALLSRADYNRYSARSLVERVFAGSAKGLMAALVSDGQLTQADIAELSALLREEQDE